jgi:hypothetical protein
MEEVVDVEGCIGLVIRSVVSRRVKVLRRLFLFLAMLPASLPGQNYLDLHWGTNYFGNYLDLRYRRIISGRISWGIGFEEGDLSFDAKGRFGRIAGSAGVPSNLSVDISTCGLLDVFLQYDRKSRRSISYFPFFGAGISGYLVRVRESSSIEGVQGLYVGEKIYHGPALFLFAGIIDYTPKKRNRISFQLGVLLRIACMKLPQEIVLFNEYDRRYFITSSLSPSTSGKGYYFPVLPVLTLGVEYRY